MLEKRVIILSICGSVTIMHPKSRQNKVSPNHQKKRRGGFETLPQYIHPV
jgi:hypothetical protein